MTRSPNTIRPILAVVLGVLALSVGDATIKAQSVSFPLWQLYALRSVIAVVLMLLGIAVWHKWAELAIYAWRWAILRSLLMAFMWVFYYASLPFVPLSTAAAALYTLPLFITIISALWLKERITPIKILALFLGFTGMLVMLRPAGVGFNPMALLSVLAAICYAFAMVMTPVKCHRESPLALGFLMNVTFVVVGLTATALIAIAKPSPVANPFLLSGWISLGRAEVVTLIILGLAITIGSTLTAYAYQRGAPTIIATFDYSYLVFSVIWGVIIFAEVPDVWTVIGMTMIMVAGVLAVQSPKQTSRRPPSNP